MGLQEDLDKLRDEGHLIACGPDLLIRNEEACIRVLAPHFHLPHDNAAQYCTQVYVEWIEKNGWAIRASAARQLDMNSSYVNHCDFLIPFLPFLRIGVVLARPLTSSQHVACIQTPQDIINSMDNMNFLKQKHTRFFLKLKWNEKKMGSTNAVSNKHPHSEPLRQRRRELYPAITPHSFVTETHFTIQKEFDALLTTLKEEQHIAAKLIEVQSGVELPSFKILNEEVCRIVFHSFLSKYQPQGLHMDLPSAQRFWTKVLPFMIFNTPHPPPPLNNPTLTPAFNDAVGADQVTNCAFDLIVPREQFIRNGVVFLWSDYDFEAEGMSVQKEIGHGHSQLPAPSQSALWICCQVWFY